jgi:hypothetical protein
MSGSVRDGARTDPRHRNLTAALDVLHDVESGQTTTRTNRSTKIGPAFATTFIPDLQVQGSADLGARTNNWCGCGAAAFVLPFAEEANSVQIPL